MPSSAIPDLIADAGADLTPTERRIAEAVVGDPTLIVFGTVSDLANAVGTSRPSVVRFATKLGFDGYAEMQEHARRRLSQQLSRPAQRIRSEYTVSGTKRAVERALVSVLENIDDARLAAMAQPISSASDVWIVSGETSRAAATVLASGLTMIRTGVRLVADHSIAQDLSSAGPGDVGVVFDFQRYRRAALTATEIISDSGATVVAVTDGPLSPYAAIADVWCEIAIPAIGPFDSSLPAVAVAEMLVAEVSHILHDDAMAHVDRVEDLWSVAGAFLDV